MVFRDNGFIMRFANIAGVARIGVLFSLVALASCQTAKMSDTLGGTKPGDENLT